MSQKGSHPFSKVRKVSKMVIFDEKRSKKCQKRQKWRFWHFWKTAREITGYPFCRKMHHKYHFLKKFLPHWAFGTFSNIWGQKWPQIDPLRPPFLTPFLRPLFGPLSKKSKFRYARPSDLLKTPSKNGPKRAILGSKLGDTFCPQKVVSKND